jgi:hypothetical protein
LQYLSEIYDYREEDARTFAKALSGGAADMPNSDATLAEIIVYPVQHQARSRRHHQISAWGDRSAMSSWNGSTGPARTWLYVSIYLWQQPTRSP